MKLVFRNKKISGIMCVLPESEVFFDDEINNYTFPEAQTKRLKSVMGFEKHRVVKQDTASSDLCIYGMEQLLQGKKINKADICAVIVVTITPDHFVPHVSNRIQGHFGLSEDVLCLDILQGCNGFLIGLMQAFMLLDYNPGKKVLLFNTDTLSKKVSKQDRNSYPLIGDCATITVVEQGEAAKPIYCQFHMDGTQGEALIIPAGGSRMPCSPETARMTDSGDGNIRNLENLVMDGAAVFQFVMTRVPPLIANTLEFAGINQEEIDWYIFHQPNKFMLQKLADKIGAPRDKLFMNIVQNFGNPSGASIPLTAAFNLGEELIHESFTCCLSAFGSGLSYGAMIMELGRLDFCEICVSTY